MLLLRVEFLQPLNLRPEERNDLLGHLLEEGKRDLWDVFLHALLPESDDAAVQHDGG